MGYGDHSDLYDHSDGMADPTNPEDQQRITRYINQRLGSTVGDRDSHKDVAREVSDKFGVLLTPGEVKDIHTGGW